VLGQTQVLLQKSGKRMRKIRPQILRLGRAPFWRVLAQDDNAISSDTHFEIAAPQNNKPEQFRSGLFSSLGVARRGGSGFWLVARPSQQSGSANLVTLRRIDGAVLGRRPLHHQGDVLQFPLEDFQRATHHANPAHCVAGGLSRNTITVPG